MLQKVRSHDCLLIMVLIMLIISTHSLHCFVTARLTVTAIHTVVMLPCCVIDCVISLCCSLSCLAVWLCSSLCCVWQFVVLLTVLCLAVHKVPDIVSRRVAGWLVAAIENLLQQGAAQHYLLVMQQVMECTE